ncbi:MAG: hypothetical protein IKZ87_07920 [Actinomycetaceae bacterium]|nr:hypothetical protein [Actinomycetaceae bacterium]
MPLQLSNEQQEAYVALFGDDDFGMSDDDRAMFAQEFSDFVKRSPNIAPDEADVILQATRDYVENPRGYTMY